MAHASGDENAPAREGKRGFADWPEISVDTEGRGRGGTARMEGLERGGGQ